MPTGAKGATTLPMLARAKKLAKMNLEAFLPLVECSAAGEECFCTDRNQVGIEQRQVAGIKGLVGMSRQEGGDGRGAGKTETDKVQ